MERRWIAALCSFVVILTLWPVVPQSSGTGPTTSEVRPISVSKTAPSGFLRNDGQLANSEVLFYGSVGEMRVGFGRGIVLLFWPRPPSSVQGVQREWNLARVTFVGAETVVPSGHDPLPFPTNFLLGNDPGAWQSDVPTYREVWFEDLYAGVDLQYRLTSQGLKYEYRLAAGVSPDVIALRYEGVETIRAVDRAAVLETSIGEIRDTAPVSFQGDSEVRCDFTVSGLSLGFSCLDVDSTRPLMIDPLMYASFLGGVGDDQSWSVAVDPSGSAYVTGNTTSVSFPTTPGVHATSPNGGRDVFVTKFSQDGSSLVYSTYIGGSGDDYAWSIQVDGTGSALISGITDSPFFPTTPGAYDTSANGIGDAYVLRLNATGSALLFSSLIGGSDWDEAWDVAVGPTGRLYVAGYTISSDFPTCPGGFDGTHAGSRDAFVAILSPTASQLLDCTFLGGEGSEIARSIALDALGLIYVTGSTSSSSFPTTAGAYDQTYAGGDDGFISKLNATAGALIYSTFLGGIALENLVGLEVSDRGTVIVSGYTASAGFPTTSGAFDQSFNGSTDAVIVELNQNGTGLVFSTFLGGSADEFLRAQAIDASGGIYVTGATSSTNFPTTATGYDTSANGGYDVFVVWMDPAGSMVRCGTYVGGPGTDWAWGLAVRMEGEAFVSGHTTSSTFPANSTSFDPTYNGGLDAFVTRLTCGELPANKEPTIQSLTVTPSVEGGPSQFSAAATDADGDPLTYSFDFQDDGTFDQIGSLTTASFTWGDDHLGTARLRVSDGIAVVEQTLAVTVSNAPPTAMVTVAPTGEGGAVSIQFTAIDPGSDDVTALVDWSDGGSDSRFYPAGGAPDLPESTDLNPRNVTDTLTHVYGDDATISGILSLGDDDAGAISYALLLVVGNVDPGNLALTVTCATRLDPVTSMLTDTCTEGETVTLSAGVTDLGSDDLTFSWDFADGVTETRTYFNDGLGPDPDPSFDGLFPFTAMDTSAHVWGDDGIYPVHLIVTDDDGGVLSAEVQVTIVNVAPTIDLRLDATAYPENTISTAIASFVDPGSDDVTLSWSWQFGPLATRTLFNDGVGPDPSGSPGGVFPFVGADTRVHRYGDNGVFRLLVTATDDDGGSASTAVDVLVVNAVPTNDDLLIYAGAEITLRVAGERFHDVCLEVIDFGSLTAGACVVRMPGSPDRQSATITGGRIQLLGDTHIALYYTPDDDPINGQRNGDNPVWVILTFADGSEVRLHHNFNVQHPGTWVWTLDDLFVVLVGKPLTFEAAASDVGSDDLQFNLDFGDGEKSMAMAFNDGLGPDPFPSPKVNPISARFTATHAYDAVGTFLFTLFISDDDGGFIILGGSLTIG